MLQVSAVEDRSMSVKLPSKMRLPRFTTTSITLQLPHNWYSDFSGFLFCTDNDHMRACNIVIKQEMFMDSQSDNDYWKEFDKNKESYEYSQVGYVPFGSLRNIPWWNSACTKYFFRDTRVVR